LNYVSFVLTASRLRVSRHGLFYVQDELFQANLPVTPVSNAVFEWAFSNYTSVFKMWKSCDFECV